MSMLGVIRGAVNAREVLGRMRREVNSAVVDTDSTTEVQIISPLEHFKIKHRNVKAHIPFSTLIPSCRKEFYGRAAEYYIEHGGGVVTYIFLAEQVSRQFNLTIAACDRQAMHQSVRNCVMGKKHMANLFPDLGDVIVTAEGVVETVVPIVNVGSKSNTKCVGTCGRKCKDDGELPSTKLKKATHGAGSFLEYHKACRAEASATSILIRDENVSYRGAAKLMQSRLIAKGVSVCKTTCRNQVMAALANSCIGLDPQWNGGQALPSYIEKEIAMTVTQLREQFFPVFPDNVMKWAAEVIAWTDHASYFPDGKPTRGWYRGCWLSRNVYFYGGLTAFVT